MGRKVHYYLNSIGVQHGSFDGRQVLSSEQAKAGWFATAIESCIFIPCSGRVRVIDAIPTSSYRFGETYRSI